MQTQLSPGQHFKNFIQYPKATRKPCLCAAIY